MPYKSSKMKKSNLSQIEMYKNNNFVANSVSSQYSSNINIMADGQRLVKGINNIKERHLKAEPKLPNLEERAAMSSNKSLYKISQQLAEISEDDNTKIYLDTVPEKNREFKLIQLCTNVDDSDIVPETDKPKKKFFRKRKSHRSYEGDGITQENVGDYIKEQVRLMTLKRLAEDDDWHCESFTKKENPQITTSCNKIQKARVSPRAKLTMKRFVDKGSDPISESELNDSSATKSALPSIPFLNKFDAYYYKYTVILHLIIFGYLIYILFVDVNDYLNEEGRYLAKMKTAYFPMKFVYFLLHLLKVRMF